MGSEFPTYRSPYCPALQYWFPFVTSLRSQVSDRRLRLHLRGSCNPTAHDSGVSRLNKEVPATRFYEGGRGHTAVTHTLRGCGSVAGDRGGLTLWLSRPWPRWSRNAVVLPAPAPIPPSFPPALTPPHPVACNIQREPRSVSLALSLARFRRLERCCRHSSRACIFSGRGIS